MAPKQSLLMERQGWCSAERLCDNKSRPHAVCARAPCHRKQQLGYNLTRQRLILSLSGAVYNAVKVRNRDCLSSLNLGEV